MYVGDCIMGVFDFINNLFSDKSQKTKLQDVKPKKYVNFTDNSQFVLWGNVTNNDNSQYYLDLESIKYITNGISGVVVKGKDNSIIQSWQYDFIKDNSNINVKVNDKDIGGFNVSDYDLRQSAIYTFYLICYQLKENKFTFKMFDFSPEAKYGINQKNKEALKIIALSKREFTSKTQRKDGIISYSYIPSTVKYNDGTLDVWLHDISNAIKNPNLKFDNYFRAHSMFHVYYDFYMETIRYVTVADINTNDEIIFLVHPQNNVRHISSYNQNDIEILWFDFFKKRYFVEKIYNKEYIMSLNWREFEQFIAKCYEKNGYKTKLTQPTCDKGKDIIAEKNGKTYFIECKHYSFESVGREILQKLMGAAGQYSVKNVILVTTSTFNKNAYECQRETNKNGMFHIELVDLDGILKLANK